MGFGLAPAFFAANANLSPTLREGGGRSDETGRRRRARSALAAAEIALAVVLLVTAGLLLRSFAKLTSVRPGFDVQQDHEGGGLAAAIQVFDAAAMDYVRRRAAGANSNRARTAEFGGGAAEPACDDNVNLTFDIVGAPPLPAGGSRTASYVAVSPGYFRVMGIPLLAGRVFNHRDVLSAPRVILVSSRMARMYFPNPGSDRQADRFRASPGGSIAREIVGVVGDVHVALGKEPGPMMFVPFAQAPFWGANVVVRSALGLPAWWRRFGGNCRRSTRTCR